ncbi:MAG: hypothetical protein E7628_03580 [Ruminococcaceae bacterium]|nr:hypothetical protein [Oscillospiraceae bacterium]
MPYIVVNVMGNASKTGNGSLWIDGHAFPLIKDGQVINIGTGVHSVKYVPTLKKSEWATTVTFDSNTVLVANVLDEDFAPPKFETLEVTDEKIAELSELTNKQKTENDQNSSGFGLGGVIVAAIIVGIIAAACGFI